MPICMVHQVATSSDLNSLAFGQHCLWDGFVLIPGVLAVCDDDAYVRHSGAIAKIRIVVEKHVHGEPDGTGCVGEGTPERHLVDVLSYRMLQKHSKLSLQDLS